MKKTRKKSGIQNVKQQSNQTTQGATNEFNAEFASEADVQGVGNQSPPQTGSKKNKTKKQMSSNK